MRRSRPMTPFQLDPSANAPWTRTIVGFRVSTAPADAPWTGPPRASTPKVSAAQAGAAATSSIAVRWLDVQRTLTRPPVLAKEGNELVASRRGGVLLSALLSAHPGVCCRATLSRRLVCDFAAQRGGLSGPRRRASTGRAPYPRGRRQGRP